MTAIRTFTNIDAYTYTSHRIAWHTWKIFKDGDKANYIYKLSDVLCTKYINNHQLYKYFQE